MFKGDSRMSSQQQAEMRNEHSEGPVSRQPYVKPDFSCEQVFESTALACTSRTLTRNST